MPNGGTLAQSGAAESFIAFCYYNNGNAQSEPTTVPASPYTRKNMSFCGWSIDSLSTPSYKPGEPGVFPADATLYAMWVTTEYDFPYTGTYVTFTIFDVAKKHVNRMGIGFDGLKRSMRGYDETSQQVVEIAYNLFKWTGKCKVTPFDISRMGYPYMEQVCNAIWIASGEMKVQIRDKENGEPELLLDDTPYQRTQQLHSRMGQMYMEMLAESPGDMGMGLPEETGDEWEEER